MNRYSIVHIPQGEIENYFNKITLELDEKFHIGNLSKKIFQHITLRYPFETDNEGIKKIEEDIKKFLIDTSSFTYTAQGFSRFLNNSKTIFIAVQDNNKICDLRQDIMRVLEVQDEEGQFLHTYHPHISIVRDVHPESSEKVLGYVQSLPVPHFDLRFDNIAIIVKINGIWQVHTLFKF
jgi:2'-5' RNA ligase